MKKLILLLFLSSLSSVFAANLPSIAVADFTSDAGITYIYGLSDLTHGLPDLLSDDLVNSGQFDVYERTKLKTIMREQNLQASGFTDPKTAVALGKLAGVHYILTGEIIDYGREIHNFTGYGVTTRSSIYRLTAAIKVIDVQSGRILFSQRADAQETVNGSQDISGAASTVATTLEEKVSDQLIAALENDNAFKAPASAANALVPVKVTSEPPAADVEVDGIFYGNAGGELKIPAGLHLVEISLPGYEKWSHKVLVQDGMSINAALMKRKDAE